ncbi:MAG: hypothetical protein HZA94_00770 [Candidatus Vogelbacteria bacterium]|nr:hypothetical protein [Candidatus Vogelbacteria bacterium]
MRRYYLKRKKALPEKSGVTFYDEMESELPFTEWTPEVEQQVKAEQGRVLNVSPDLIAKTRETLKRKLKIRVENVDTKRVYTIGVVTKTRGGGRTKKSLSIEYVGRESGPSDNQDEPSTENLIIKDIKNIEEKVSIGR